MRQHLSLSVINSWYSIENMLAMRNHWWTLKQQQELRESAPTSARHICPEKQHNSRSLQVDREKQQIQLKKRNAAGLARASPSLGWGHAQCKHTHTWLQIVENHRAWPIVYCTHWARLIPTKCSTHYTKSFALSSGIFPPVTSTNSNQNILVSTSMNERMARREVESSLMRFPCNHNQKININKKD